MTALDKSTRRKIFYTMVLVFLVFAPLVLLYSRGYVFDFKRSGLSLTGGIFVKAIQQDVKVYMDSNLENETSFISRGTLITSLLPKHYTVRVEKSGFRSWTKTALVSNEEVLEFRNIFLPPATITPAVLFNTRQPSLPSQVTLLAGTSEVGLSVGDPAKTVSLYVLNPETGATTVTSHTVSRSFWDQNANTMVLGRTSAGRTRWYRINLRADGTGTESPVMFRGLPEGFSADLVTPHPTAPGSFYFFAGGVLFLQDKSNVPTPIAEGIYAYTITDQHIYFISKTGFFVESDLLGGNTKILGRKGLFLNDAQPPRILVSPAGDVVVLDSAGGLFVYQPDRDQELELVVGNVKGIDFSANGDRILYWDDKRVSIYWLRDNPDQPFDIARTKKQIFSSDQPIQQAFLNALGTYFFFSDPAGIHFVETDVRGSTNAYLLIAGSIGSFTVDAKNQLLFWTEGAKLYRASYAK